MDKALQHSISRTKDLGLWLHARCNEMKYKCSEREQTCLAILQHCEDIHDAMVVLIENRLPGPALALARPLFEGYSRAFWLRHTASQSELEKFTNGKAPKFSELCASLNELTNLGSAWILNNKKVNWTSFNDLTHGGNEHVRRRLTNDSVESAYPETELTNLLAFALEVRIRIGVEHFSIGNRAQEMVELSHLAEELRKPMSP